MKTLNLNTEQKIANAIKWIDGLRNTKFKQAKHHLGNKENGFCCLGYGCHRLKIDFEFCDADSIEFQKAVGLSAADGRFNHIGYTEKSVIQKREGLRPLYADNLIDLNDDLDYSFRRISTFIKSRLEDLFVAPVAKGLIKHYNNK